MCVCVCSVLVVRMCVYVSVVYACVLCRCMHIKKRKMVPITTGKIFRCPALLMP